MRTIIAGGRAFDNMPVLLRAIEDSGFVITEVVSGACGIDADVVSREHRTAIGADGLGETYARLHGLPVRRFYAAFSESGAKAGPMRNAIMAGYAAEALPEAGLIALPGGRGTASMIREARKRGLRVYVVSS
jgi:hypothetical protein